MKNCCLLFFIIAICFSSCKRSNDAEIGVIIPLSGNYSDVGNWMRVGIDLAVEDYNKENNKMKLIPLYEDSQSKPALAISAYQKLKNTHHINFFISTVSSVCLALKPLVVHDSTFLIVNAGHKDILPQNPSDIFRHALTLPQEAKFISEEIKSRHLIDENTKISLLYTNNDIGVEFKENFVARFENIPIIKMFSYDESENNLKNVIQKLLIDKPDFIVIYGYTKNFGQVIRTIREQQYNDTIYVNQGFSTPTVIENAGVAGNNVFYTDYDFPDNDAMKLLKKRVYDKYGVGLSSMNITSYNIMMIIGEAINATNSLSPKNISEYLRNKGKFEINGMEINVGKNGDIYVPLKLVENKYNK